MELDTSSGAIDAPTIGHFSTPWSRPQQQTSFPVVFLDGDSNDLGGNATAVGASANVVVLGIAARNGHPISFWQFTKNGLFVATVTIAIAWVYVALRYFTFA